jgi:solute carrier family 6 (neurotransmitter transporter, glycine) member 5/9
MKAVQTIPLLKGVGWGQQIASGIITTYYSAIIALTLAYVANSFSFFDEGNLLPWSDCRGYDPEVCHAASSIIPNHNQTDSISSSAELFFR